MNFYEIMDKLYQLFILLTGKLVELRETEVELHETYRTPSAEFKERAVFLFGR